MNLSYFILSHLYLFGFYKKPDVAAAHPRAGVLRVSRDAAASSAPQVCNLRDKAGAGKLEAAVLMSLAVFTHSLEQGG